MSGLRLPSSWQEHTLPYLPSNAEAAFFSARPSADSLTGGASAAVLAVWLVVAVAAAATTLTRRDV